MTVGKILKQYVRGGDFEDSRDALHALGPEAMRAVLEAAMEPNAKGLDLLVMVLADALYPPALPQMRVWLEHDDVDGIAMPAASALDRTAGGRFKVERFWSGDRAELPLTFRALAEWWDSGKATPPSETEWLAARRAKRQRDAGDVPPPSPQLSEAERNALRDELITLRKELSALSPAMQHRLDLAAIRRVVRIFEAWAPGERVLHEALAAVEAGDGAAHEGPVTEALRRANGDAGWNPAHGRYRRPEAKAAANVAQGVLYALSPEVRNRLQAMHFARDAIEYAGGGFEAVRAELRWQLELVRDESK